MYLRYACLVALALTACSPAVQCGEGTVLRGNSCVVDTDGAANDAAARADNTAADAGFPRDANSLDAPSDVGSADTAVLDATSDAGDRDVFTSDVPSDSGSRDVPIVDAGPVEIRADDTLLIGPTMATLFPGHRLCPSFTLLRADGTRVPVLPGSATATVTPNDTSVLGVAEAADCGPLGGVLALASHATTARWTMTSAGASISAVLPVTIADGHIEVAAALDVTLPVGGALDYQLSVRYLLSGGGTGTPSSQARLVPRWFTGLQSAPSSLLGPLTAPDDALMLHPRGAAVGSGHIVGTYGPPGAGSSLVSAGTVTVVTPGTLTSVGPIYHYRDGLFVSQGAPGSMAPGECLEMRVRGAYDSGGVGYALVLDPSSIAWTVSGQGHLSAGPPTQICATTRGETVVRACVLGVCGAETIPVMVPGEASTLTFAPGDITITQTILGAFSGCIPLRATLRFADSTTRDVTESGAMHWSVPFMPGAPVNFFRAESGGMLTVDGAGNPCFNGYGPAMRSYDFMLGGSYGGVAGTAPVAMHIR